MSGKCTDTEGGEPPSLDELARRYLDLWQDQWAAVAADPDVADAFTRTLAAIGQSAASLFPMLWPAHGPAPGTGDADDGGFPRPAPTATAPGPQTAGDPFGGGSRHVAELSHRIAVLEERLASLAAEPAGQGDVPSGKPRRRSRR